jgi:hypothetical protein
VSGATESEVPTLSIGPAHPRWDSPGHDLRTRVAQRNAPDEQSDRAGFLLATTINATRRAPRKLYRCHA